MLSQVRILVVSGLVATVFAAGPWQQCGGNGWTGDTSCDSGWTCQAQNDYYSQCLQGSGNDDDTCDGDDGSEEKDTTPTSSSAASPPPTSANAPPATSSSSGSGSDSGSGSSSPPPSTGNDSGSCGAYTGDKTGYASTTHYYDGTEGACGCGTGGTLASWQASPGSGLFTAAGSQNLFGGSGSWCGSGCGTCYELTNVGAIAAEGQGDCTGNGDTITVMITNLCPANGNEQWCSVPDQYGFPAHFDIMSQGGPNGWNNPVVSYKEVACPGSLTSDWQTCQCASGAQSRARRGLMGDTF